MFGVLEDGGGWVRGVLMVNTRMKLKSVAWQSPAFGR